jgi:hypothetical protein
MTLYIPKPYIRKSNVVVMIELLGAEKDYIEFIDHHIFKFNNDGAKQEIPQNRYRRPYKNQ